MKCIYIVYIEGMVFQKQQKKCYVIFVTQTHVTVVDVIEEDGMCLVQESWRDREGEAGAESATGRRS